MIVKRNWRDAHPTIAHQSGLDWRLLSSAIKTSGDIEESGLDPQCRCHLFFSICQAKYPSWEIDLFNEGGLL